MTSQTPSEGSDPSAGRQRIDSPPSPALASPPGSGRARGTVLSSLLRSVAATVDRIRSPASPASPALGSLVRSMARPEFRDAFHRDPKRALRDAGLDERGLRHEQLEVLQRLSVSDLEVLARVVGGLRRANDGRAVSL